MAASTPVETKKGASSTKSAATQKSSVSAAIDLLLNPLARLQDVGETVFKLPLSVWALPLMLMLGVTGDDVTRTEGFSMYIMFVSVMYVGAKINNRIENSEWRQELKRDANASKRTSELEEEAKKKREEKKEEKKDKAAKATGSTKKTQ